MPSKLPIKYDLFEGTILLADGDLLYIPYDSASAVFPLKAICHDDTIVDIGFYDSATEDRIYDSPD